MFVLLLSGLYNATLVNPNATGPAWDAYRASLKTKLAAAGAR